MPHRWRALRRLALVLVGLTALSPAAAVAHRGDGVFLLAPPVGAGATGVLTLPDASVLVASGSVRRYTPDGRVALVRGLGATGLALSPDGSVLALDARPERNVVRHWRPGGPVVTVAGRGGGVLQGFGGDGGPATGARLRLYVQEPLVSGILALPLGGFVFAQRVRGVDATGVIRTVAGNGRLAGPGSAFLGDGRPAPAAGFAEPAGLAAIAGGGYLVAERRGRRLRRVRPDGIAETVVDGLRNPLGVTVLADGSTVFTDDGLPWRLARGGRRPTPLFRRSDTDPDDFAGRLVIGHGVAHDGRGGLLLAGGGGVFYAPRGATPWPLAALRATRIGRRAVDTTVELTRPGVAIVEVSRRGRVLARVTRRVGAGHATLRAPGDVPSDWLRVAASVRFGNASTRADSVVVHGARRLTVPLARRLLGRVQEVDESSESALGPRCRRFGARRVDCEVRVVVGDGDGGTDESCNWIASLSLAPTGVVLQRRYPCGSVGRAVFRARPRWDAEFGAVNQGPRGAAWTR